MPSQLWPNGNVHTIRMQNCRPHGMVRLQPTPFLGDRVTGRSGRPLCALLIPVWLFVTTQPVIVGGAGCECEWIINIDAGAKYKYPCTQISYMHMSIAFEHRTCGGV